jgi:hypothetical protein
VIRLLLGLILILSLNALAQTHQNQIQDAEKKVAKKILTPKPVLQKKIPLEKKFRIGAELRSYRYEEPNIVTHSGWLWGVWLENKWKAETFNINTNASLHYGVIDYDGALCDLSNNCSPYFAKTTDLIIKTSLLAEIEVSPSVGISAGLGFRYLSDKGDGTGFYLRTGNWFYVPVFAVYRMPLNDSAIEFQVGYEHVVYGSMKSNLSEVNSNFEDIVHGQDKGYGLSAGANWKTSDWIYGGYYEIWSLERSNAIEVNSTSFVEPESKTDMFVIKVGYLF